MTPNEPAMHDLQPVHRLSEPRFRPRPVFTLDDASSGSDKGTAELPKVLIVEDDYLVASEIEGALIEAGFDVVGVAESAEEAIEIAAAKRPALAVMDVRLNGSPDGIDAARELFETYGTRSVFATAHHDAEIRERAKPANPLGWIPKPYTMLSLIQIVRNAVRDLQAKNQKN